MPEPRTILLVEDSADDAALAKAAFERVAPDHRLVTVEDGEEALAYVLHEGHDPSRMLPDLILLDLELPGIDGFEVLRRIRQHARAAVLPVVVLTSSLEDKDVMMSYRMGANSYVRKPVDFDEFVPVVEQLVRYWLGLNQAPHLR